MDKLIELLNEQLNEGLKQIVISNPRKKDDVVKIKIRPVLIGKELKFQAESFRGTQVFHENLTKKELISKAEKWVGDFKQLQLTSATVTATALASKDGRVTVTKKKVPGSDERNAKKTPNGSQYSVQNAQNNVQNNVKNKVDVPVNFNVNLMHNRQKKYLLPEGVPVKFLIDLGVQTKEGKIVNSKYDKFRQINRFLEFIEDIADQLPKDREIRILDFGCGKSYLTFAMYEYLHKMKGFDVRITGLDLKKDVIENCNHLAKKYGYEKLEFVCGDVADYNETDHIDMMVTLHACDTATDYALANAVKWGAKVILSVPCCQHEFNKTIQNDLFESVFKYGILKERMAALITDGMRAELLEEQGYDTQILEFIDMEHTPKNLLIRAVKKGKAKSELSKKYADLAEALKVDGTLKRLLY